MPAEVGVTDQSQLITLADGTRWISQLAKTQYPQARLILDWGHLEKHLWQTVGAALQSCLGLGQQMELSAPADKTQTQLGESSLQSFYLYPRNNSNSIVDYHSYQKKLLHQ